MSAAAVVLASSTPPAGGAALGEVFAATAGVGLVTLVLFGIAVAHRTRRITWLGRFATAAGARTGRPGWVALPSLLNTVALLTALFGMLWDISLHIGQGRDEGPLANPAHYFILVGLFLVFTAGMLAIVLPLDDEPGPAAVRITRTWRAPVGGLLVAGAGFYALLGFPLDDVWHRLFGQDVTLWGPTHLMLITGAGLSLIGMLVLEQEGRSATPLSHAQTPVVAWLLRTFALGGMLIGLSVFQAEFDFGVPQFRLVLQPMMIAAAAGLALVAARLIAGPGGAVACALFFLVIRGVMSLLVGPVLGEPTPSFPLYVGSAVLVELVALSGLIRRPLLFGVVAGLAVGTVGTGIEAAWSWFAMPLPWTRDVWVEGLIMSVAVAVAAGACGALLAEGLAGRLPRPGIARPALVASVLVLTAATANGLYATVPDGARATVALTGAETGLASAQVTLDPATVADGPAWVQLTAWQGGGLVVDRLERTGPGTYRSTEPIPVDGDWKTLLRVHDGRTLTASPVFLPQDDAIQAEQVPAQARSTRAFVPEIALLQRERQLDVPAWSWGLANLVVLLCSIALIVALAWGVGRLARRTGEGTGSIPPPPSPPKGAGAAALRPGLA
ncbi:MAG: conserved rane protein of unknown function [Frankiales bacterium]|nr:conserved rane protein of unknown function [Frankiales bacterium]